MEWKVYLVTSRVINFFKIPFVTQVLVKSIFLNFYLDVTFKILRNMAKYIWNCLYHRSDHQCRSYRFHHEDFDQRGFHNGWKALDLHRIPGLPWIENIHTIDSLCLCQSFMFNSFGCCCSRYFVSTVHHYVFGRRLIMLHIHLSRYFQWWKCILIWNIKIMMQSKTHI